MTSNFRTCAALAALLVATPASADRHDVIKGMAAFDAMISLARDNCPKIDHDKVMKTLIGALLVINETDAEVDESDAIEAGVRVQMEEQMHKIGTVAWCRHAKGVLKEYEK
jgi:hypothetical protein